MSQIFAQTFAFSVLIQYHRKSQIAIEYCYRFQESNPDSHVLWVYGGSIARFYECYKRIATLLELPGFDDPQVIKLDLVK